MRDDASDTYKNGADIWKSLKQDKPFGILPT